MTALLYSFSIFSFIIGLLFSGCPPAIIGFVIPVIIYSINGVFGGSLCPHIRNKYARVIEPSFAYSNPSTAIIRIFSIVFVKTTRFHVVIRNQFSRKFSSFRISMSTVYFRNLFVSKTPAAFSVPVSKMVPHNSSKFTAITLTQPKSLSVFITTITRNYRKPVDFLISHVNCIVHIASDIKINTFSQAVFL